MLIVNIILNLILIPPLSFFGAAIATLISEIILFAVFTHITHRIVPYEYIWPSFSKILLAGFVMALACLLIRKAALSVLIDSTIAIVAYAVAIRAQGLASISQIRSVLKG
jgi:O-antigen/teichoic acid export membrane protein